MVFRCTFNGQTCVYSCWWVFTLLLSLIEWTVSMTTYHGTNARKQYSNFYGRLGFSLCVFSLQKLNSNFSTFFYSELNAWQNRALERVRCCVSLFLYLHAKFLNILSTHDSVRSRHFKNTSYVRIHAIRLILESAFVFYFLFASFLRFFLCRQRVWEELDACQPCVCVSVGAVCFFIHIDENCRNLIDATKTMISLRSIYFYLVHSN